MTTPIEEALLAVMTEAHTVAIKDDTPYPKIRLHDLARIIGGDYHARVRKMKDGAVARERERLESILRPLRTTDKRNYDVVLWRDVKAVLTPPTDV